MYWEMTNIEMMQIAMEQSAEDIGCKPEEFLSDKNVITNFQLSASAKKYYKLPISGNFISYGNNVVAAAADENHDIIKEYLNKGEFYHLFETPKMHWLNEKLAPLGQTVCFMAEYFLPDTNRLKISDIDYEIKVLEKEEFENLYLPEWSNALCADRKNLDVLCVGAYDGEKLIGLAGCSADADKMWQIGVDVLPAYRRKGIASAITTRLALETLDRGKVPFYCCAWSNVRSARNAIKSGFSAAWVEMTIKPIDVVQEMIDK